MRDPRLWTQPKLPLSRVRLRPRVELAVGEGECRIWDLCQVQSEEPYLLRSDPVMQGRSWDSISTHQTQIPGLLWWTI